MSVKLYFAALFFVLVLLVIRPATSVAADSSGSLLASLSGRIVQEGASVTFTCAFNGPPPFGTFASDLQLLKFVSMQPFTAANESELTDFTDSPTSQPIRLVDGAAWRLELPWASYAQRYNRTVTHNLTSASFHIISAVAEDSGYYGCGLKSVKSSFKPLLVYAKDIAVNVTVLIGASSSVPSIAGELAVHYDSMRSSFVEVALQLDSSYASLGFQASLFSGRGVSPSVVVSPHAEQSCVESRSLCVWTVRLMVQLVLSDVRQLHLDRLSLSVSHPGSAGAPLWRSAARLLDDSQSQLPAKVTNRTVACTSPAAVRVRHGSPLTIACSVPRLWLSLPGFSAYWSVSSPVQFYPVGQVACAYPRVGPRPAVADFSGGLRAMLDPPGPDGIGACLANPFLDNLDADFDSRELPGDFGGGGGGGVDWGRVEYRYRVPAAYFVHAGRRATFHASVGDAAYRQEPAPQCAFQVEVESETKSAMKSVCPAQLLLPLMSVLLLAAVL